MATSTYDLLESVTLATAASSVTFSSISATGKGDLVAVWDVLSAPGSGTIQLENLFNSDTGNNYNRVIMAGNGSTTSSASSSGVDSLQLFTGGRVTESIRGLFTLQIMDYAATDKHKSALGRCSATNDELTAGAGRWADTSAITSVTIQPTLGSVSFAIGSTFNLYQLVSE